MEVRDSNPYSRCESKRISQLITNVVIILFGSAFICNAEVAQSDFSVDGFNYAIISEAQKNVKVVSTTLTENIIIPTKVRYNNYTYTVTEIGEHAFDSSEAHVISIPYTIKAIRDKAFLFCKNLSSIELPEDLEILGADAFRGCALLENIRIPYKVQDIGWTTFAGCTSLASISLPVSIQYLNVAAFIGCVNLKTIFLESDFPPRFYYYTSNKEMYDNQFSRFLEDSPYCEFIVLNKDKYQKDRYWGQLSDRMIEIITLGDNQYVYTGKPQILNWTSNLSQYEITVESDKPIINAGAYTAGLTLSCYNQGCKLAEYHFDYSYVIEKASLDIAIENITREYGDENPSLRYISLTGFVNGESLSSLDNPPTLTTDAKKNSAPGNYSINVTLDDQNYRLNYATGILTVTKAPLNVAVDNATREYGDYNPSFKLSYQGLKCGETSPYLTKDFTIQTDANLSSPVGSYEVTVEGGASPNYTFTYSRGLLDITKAQLTVRVNNASKLYFEENPSLSYILSGVKIVGEDPLTALPTILCEADKESPSGYYSIIATGAEAPNYNISYINGQLEVRKRQMTITANNCNRKYGEENPKFTFNYSGFVNGEDVSVLEKLPTGTCPATKDSNVGKYAIWPRDAEAHNYSFNYNKGILTIDKANQHIEWNQSLDDCHVGDQIELTGVATSGLRITYLVGDESMASVYWIGDVAYLDCIKPGEVSIRANQDGDSNYLPAVRMSKIITIKSSSGVEEILMNKTAEDGLVYDLYGRVVTDIVPGQLYIKNGKKYIQRK